MQLHAADSVEAPQNKSLAEGAISGTEDPEGSESEDTKTYVIYRCPKRHRCKCMCSIRVAMGRDFYSHANDGSKYVT